MTATGEEQRSTILELFERDGEPRSTHEVAAATSMSPETTLRHLDRLVELEELAVKSVHSSTQIWWRPRDTTEESSSDIDTIARLETFSQLCQLGRDITQTILEQPSRPAVEQYLCTRLLELPFCERVWCGEHDPVNGCVGLRGPQTAEGIVLDHDAATPGTPISQALENGTVQSTTLEPGDGLSQSLSLNLDDSSPHTLVAIPIRHDEMLFGVVVVLINRSVPATDAEQHVFAHLGEVAGHAIAANELTQAVLTDDVVELELCVPSIFAETDLPGTDSRIEIDRVVTIDEDRHHVYMTMEATDGPEYDAETLAEAIPDCEAATVHEDQFGTRTTQLEFSTPSVLSEIVRSGSVVDEAIIEDGSLQLTIHVPKDTDVRRVIDRVKERFPSASPIARRQVASSSPTERWPERTLSEELTDRQRTVLETAFYSGYFEWPRATAGEAVAESLDISHPTFSQHLRTAERKVFAALFDEV